MKKLDFKVIALAVVLLLLVAGSFSISIFTSQRTSRITTSSQASSSIPAECKCTDPNICSADGCSRVPKTPENTFDDARYQNICNQYSQPYRMPDSIIQYYCSVRQPSCCEDIYKYKDDRLCCFQERWTCHPAYCEGASGNGDCGKYWGLPIAEWNSYGCVSRGPDGNPVGTWGNPPGLPGSGSTPPTNTPVPQIPTNTPVPAQTTSPVNQPTSLPTQPTATLQPTKTNSQPTVVTQPTTIINQPTEYNPQPTAVPQPTSTPIEIKSPKELAQEVINPESVQRLSESTDKALAAPREGFTTLKSYDQKLESTIQNWWMKLRMYVTGLRE